MSISSISKLDELDEDVLLMIFQQLEGEDLVKCEAVCRQWRDILLTGTPWRRLFDRKTKISPLWRRAQKKLELNQRTLGTDQYRGVCKNILQGKRNWHTGNFTTCIYPMSTCEDFELYFTMSDDYVAWDFFRRGTRKYIFAFLDTESPEITEIPLDSRPLILDGIVVRYTDTSTVENLDPKNHWTINLMNEEDTGFRVRQLSSGSNLFVCYSACVNERERFKIWKLGNPPTLLRTRTFEDRHLYILEVDERFIVAKQATQEALYFFSTETLEELKYVSLRDYKYE
jgi:F-box-like